MREPADRFVELAVRYLDGVADASEVAELNALLAGDARAQDRFIELSLRRQAMVESLATAAGSTTEAEPVVVGQIVPEVVIAPEPTGRRRITRWAAAAALAAVLTLGGVLIALQIGNGDEDAGEVRAVARLVAADGVVWVSAAQAPDAALMPGTLDIASGRLDVVFASGATVSVHGPATMTLRGSNALTLDRGFLQALVPTEAAGFAVDTPDGRIVDLGTEFSVIVGPWHRTQVHVTDGRVRVHGGAGSQLLLAGDAARLTDGLLESIDPIEVAYPGNRYAPWWRHAQTMRDDPALLAYFDMQDLDGDALTNRGALGDAAQARAQGVQLADGRFAGKRGLRFDAPGDARIEIDPAAEERFDFAGSFSVAVWCRADELGEAWQGLVTKGDSSWRLHRYDTTGYVGFGTNVGGKAFDLPSATPIDDGRWHLIVAVCEAVDGGAHKRLYIDGRLDAEERVGVLDVNDFPVWIGNNAERTERAWDGWIDEVALFGRALSPDEVKRMYETGRVSAAPALE